MGRFPHSFSDSPKGEDGGPPPRDCGMGRGSPTGFSSTSMKGEDEGSPSPGPGATVLPRGWGVPPHNAGSVRVLTASLVQGSRRGEAESREGRREGGRTPPVPRLSFELAEVSLPLYSPQLPLLVGSQLGGDSGTDGEDAGRCPAEPGWLPAPAQTAARLAPPAPGWTRSLPPPRKHRSPYPAHAAKAVDLSGTPVRGAHVQTGAPAVLGCYEVSAEPAQLQCRLRGLGPGVLLGTGSCPSVPRTLRTPQPLRRPQGRRHRVRRTCLWMALPRVSPAARLAPRWALPECPRQRPGRRPAPVTGKIGNSSARGSLPKIRPGRATPRVCPCPHHPLGHWSCLAPRLQFHCPFTESPLPSGVGLSRPFVPRGVIGAPGSGAGLLEAQNGSLSAYTALIPPELLRQR